MSKIVSFNKPLLGLDGKEITIQGDLTLPQRVGNALYLSSTNDPIRYSEMAKKIYADGEVDIETKDVAVLNDVMKKSGFINIICDHVNQILNS